MARRILAGATRRRCRAMERMALMAGVVGGGGGIVAIREDEDEEGGSVAEERDAAGDG